MPAMPSADNWKEGSLPSFAATGLGLIFRQVRMAGREMALSEITQQTIALWILLTLLLLIPWVLD